MQFKQQENIHFQASYVLALAISKLMAKIKLKNNIYRGLTIACLGLIGNSQANAAYTFTDLSTLAGGFSSTNNYGSSAKAINASGQVAGYSSGIDPSVIDLSYRATLWSGNTTNLKGNPRYFGFANAINDSGHIAGYTNLGGFYGTTATVDGGRYLSPLSGYNYGFANGINSTGQVVGYSFAGNYFVHATLWNNYGQTDLGTLGGDNSYANAINDSGQVVGYSDLGNGIQHATLWNGTTAIDLGTLGGNNSHANAINSSGQVVGYSDIVNGIQHATLWNGTSAIDLDTSEGFGSQANAINALGQVVGFSNGHATLWNGTTATDLNILLDANTLSAGWRISSANGINDNGWIVGDASNSLLGISQHAFLLSVAAVPEPETYAMLLAGIGLIGFKTRRRHYFDQSNQS